MKKILMSLVLMLMLGHGLSAQNINSPYVEVSDKATRSVVPDRIYIRVLLNESDNRKTDMSLLEKRMFSALKSAGIDTKNDVVLSDFSSDFYKIAFKGNQAKVEKIYQVLAKDTQTAMKVLLALQEENLANAYIQKMECSRMEEYEKECSTEALKKARARAEHLAAALGQKIGPAIFIQEYPSRNVYRKNGMMMESAPSVDAAIPEVDLNIQIESTVNVKFILFTNENKVLTEDNQ